MKLLDRLRKRRKKAEKEKKGRLQQEDSGTRKSDSENSRARVNRKEKWIARKRGNDGKLRHIVTSTCKPTEKDLVNYGPGEYHIQKVGRKFSKAEKITIAHRPEKKNASRQDKFAQASHQLDQAQAIGSNWSSTAAKESTSSRTMRGEIAKKKEDDKAQINTRITTETPSKAFPGNTGYTERKHETLGLEKAIHGKEKEFDIRKIISELTDKIEKIDNTESEEKPRGEKLLRDRAQRLDTRPPTIGKTNISRDPTVSEKARVAEVTATPPQSRSEEPSVDYRVSNERKVISCAKCGKYLCDEKDLSLWRDEVAKCEFCGRYYCVDCFQNINVPSPKCVIGVD